MSSVRHHLGGGRDLRQLLFSGYMPKRDVLLHHDVVRGVPF